MPQVQTIRDVLDAHATCTICRETEVSAMLDMFKTPPALVVTDSQAFEAVSAQVPDSIPLTGFSVLFARFKGELHTLTQGALALSRLKPGDRVLEAAERKHPSPHSGRHRTRQNSPMARKTRRRRALHRHRQWSRFSQRSLTLPRHRSLWGLHVDSPTNVEPHPTGHGTKCPHHQLRSGHRGIAWHSATRIASFWHRGLEFNGRLYGGQK